MTTNFAMKNKPQLLYITSDFPHLRRGFSAHELTELTKYFDVILYSINSADNNAKKWVNSGFPSLNAISYVSLNKYDIAKSCFSRIAILKIISELPRLIKFCLKDFTGGIKYFYGVAAGIGVAKFLKQKTAARIHCDFASMPATIGMIASDLTNIPYSFTSHAFDIFTNIPNGKCTKEILKLKIRKASYVYGVNSEAYKKLCDLLADGEAGSANKITIKRNGISLEENTYKFPSVPRQPENVLRIIGLGALVNKKGFDLLIESVALLSERGIIANLRIHGEGPEKENLISTARILNVNLQLPGAYMYSELRGIINAADVVVMPSRVDKDGDMDGVPTVLIEALAQHKPVIGSDIGSIRDIVLHDKTGLLVKSEDVVELADAIEYYYRHPEIMFSHAGNGYQLVASKFNVETCNEKFITTILEQAS